MPRKAAVFNVLPPGSTLCGWCEAEKDRADREITALRSRYRPIVSTLRAIAGVGTCAPYCRNADPKRDWGSLCTRCMAREGLARFREAEKNASAPEGTDA